MYRDRLRASPVFFSARNVTRKFISPVDAPRDRSLVFRRPGKSIVCLIGTLIAPPPSERLRIGTRQREENVASLPLPPFDKWPGDKSRRWTNFSRGGVSFMKRLLLNRGV